jgi:DNA mismatch repair protein MutL
MPKIQVLPARLVNRIAAGECVERPASVVKELMENALDAGAGRISVQIEEGGRELIQVLDDGCGMDAADLALCALPHATSKLRDDDDLFNIHTMGFRGEALPSIGAVARVQITSRPADADVAGRVRIDAGVVEPLAPCAAPLGTAVEVRDLFYCVPARRKFLRTPQAESGHVTEQFARIALAQPRVAFTLTRQGRVAHELPAAPDTRRRIGDLYGAELAEVLLPIRREGAGVRIEGHVAPPAESRGSGKWEYVFVNGRPVRDKFVSHAIREAYRSLIDPARFPVVFLFITIDPQQVDVNVHPTKSEVRWRDSNYVHGQTLAALRDKFLSTNLDHSLRARQAQTDDYKQRVQQAMVEFFTSGGGERGAGRNVEGGVAGAPRRAPRADLEAGRHGEAPSDRAPSPLHAPAPPDRAASALGGQAGQEVGHEAAARGADASSDAFDADAVAPPRGALQVHNMYIVAETADGLMIIDQHAMHERILYEKFRARVAREALESQRLLLPEVVRVPGDRIEALETHAELLGRLGLDLTASGLQSVTLHAFPSFLERVDRVSFVRDLLDLLSDAGARPSAETVLHDVLDMMACKAAVKFGDALTRDEIAALLERRELAERSSHCPHGRPTTLHLTLRDLERQFKRR